MHSCVLLLYDDGHFEDYAIWYQTYLITDNCVEFDTWCSPDNRVISVTYSVAQKYGHDIKLDTQNLPGWGDVSLNFRRLLRVVFTPSATSVRAEDNQESDNDTENDSQETESSSLETSTFFYPKSLCEHCENSDVYGTLILKCPKCFWHDFYKICSICDHQIPEERVTPKSAFFDITIAEQLHTNTRRRWKPISTPLLKRRTKTRIN